MLLKELAKQKISWLKSDGDKNGNGTVISSRARLARNIADKPFPGRADRIIQLAILDKVVSIVPSLPELANTSHIHKLSELNKTDRRFLVERHLISRELAASNGEPGLIFTNSENISIMVNEEDHLRIQTITPGFTPTNAENILSNLDDKLSKYLKFAYHPQFGYLTACPTNLGTGLRISCLVHLPGLVTTNEIERLINGLSRLGLTARGFYGEGTKPIGDIFQISNAVSVGKTEKEIVENLEKVVRSVVRYETIARKKLLENRHKRKTEDKVYRAYGILVYAKSIESEEAILNLSRVRLGISLKMNFNIDYNSIDQLIFMIQPAHLQEIAGKELNAEQRDMFRAELIHKTLNPKKT